MRAHFLLLIALLVALPTVPTGSALPAGPFAPPGLHLPGERGTTDPGSALATTELAAARHSISAGGPGALPWTCHGDPAWANNACRLSRYALAPAGASTGTGWVPSNSSPPPQSDFDFEMTYDAADGYVLLLGSPAGPYGAATTTDLWSYQHGNWSDLRSTQPPFNCPGSSLSYDSVDGYVLFFGAPVSYYASDCPTGGTTWSYRAGLWQNITPTLSPAARWGASLVNDSTDGYLLLFGGNVYNCTGFTPAQDCNYGYLNDTWKFVGGLWSRLNPVHSPSWRATAGLADDPPDGAVVLFGGSTPYGVLNDTWNFSAGNWTQLHPGQSPPIPVPDGFSYDAADRVLLYTNVFPNFNSTTAFEVTWTFSAGHWTPVSFSSGPLSRSGAEQAYDYGDGYTLLFGGLVNYGYQDTADAWSYVAGAWTNRTPPVPIPRSTAMLAYDDASSDVLLFGGASDSYSGTTVLNDTWTYDSTGWTERHPAQAPSARAAAGMVYDATDGYVLLFGGNDYSSGYLNDTWEYTGGLWVPLTPSRAPPAVRDQTMVYDGGDGYVLLFTNASGVMSTWTYHAGIWTNRTFTAGSPPKGPTLDPMVYDSTDGYVLLFTTYQRGFTNETWKFAGGTWSNLTGSSGHAPPFASSASVVDYPPGGYALYWTSSPANTTWIFTQGNWTSQYSPLGPSARSGMYGAYDPLRKAAVFFGGNGAAPDCSYFGPCGQTWFWSSGGANVPSVRSFTVQPGGTDVGSSVQFILSAVGGVLPLTYAYSGLPPGCTSSNTSILPCTPTAVGNYTVQGKVTDAAGNLSTGTTTLTVAAAPLVALSASPPNISLGAHTLLQSVVTGGLAPYTYNYSGLPPGCTTQTVPALPCTPTAAGSYSVGVVLIDAVGLNASGSIVLLVRPVGGSGGPSVSSFNATPAALVLGNATNFSVSASGGIPPYFYAYSGLPTGCTSSNLSTLPCTPTAAGSYTVSVNVTDSTGNGTSVGTNLTVYPAGGGAGLKVSAFGPTAPSPSQFLAFGLKVIASGGHPPLAYLYSGLPPGCDSLSRSELSCTPSGWGSYRLHVTVSDTSGDRVTVPLGLWVAPSGTGSGLAILSFAPVPSVIVLGASTVLTVNVSGGSGDRTFLYTGLPQGCSAASTPTLPCTPSALGTFPIQVAVTDSAGDSANATTVLTVSAAPPGGSSGTPTSGLSGIDGVLIGVALGITAVVVGSVGFWLGRRRFTPPPPPE